MANQFVKDATALYYKMRKTNKNYKFSNALKDAAAQRKKNMSSATKTMKRMEHTAEDAMNNAATSVSNAASNLTPFKPFASKRKGTRHHTKKSRRMSQTKRNRH